MHKSLQNILELNLAIIFISTSGALGRYIDLPVPMIIAMRALIAGIVIFFYCKWQAYEFKIHKADLWKILLSGLFMGLHWLTYFYALKLSNVAIGMLSLFTYPIITSILEPIILRTRFQKIHLVLGLLVIPGIYFLIPNFDFNNDYSKALALGIISAIFYSLRNIITKTKVNEYNGSILMFYQLIIISIIFTPFNFIIDTDITAQIPEIILLALLTTAIGHTWFINSFKNFTVTSASIISSIQPVYGIIIGIVFLREYPETKTIIGGLFIITTVIMESVITYKRSIQTVDFKKIK